MRPFFSVIIPSRNRRHFLKIAVDSVLGQTYGDFELIVIDDGSTDDTPKMLAEFDDPRLLCIQQSAQGVSAARNHGIKTARGEFICFLDSDDRFRQEKLRTTADYILRYPEYKIFHTEEIWYRSGALLPQKDYHKKPSGNVFHSALKLCCISPSASTVHCEVFKICGGFDESFPACEDYEFWLRVTCRFKVFLIPEYLTIKQGGHPDQLSHKYPAIDRFRIHAIEKIIGSDLLNPHQRELALAELKRKCGIYIPGAEKRGKTKEAENCKKILEKFK